MAIDLGGKDLSQNGSTSNQARGIQVAQAATTSSDATTAQVIRVVPGARIELPEVNLADATLVLAGNDLQITQADGSVIVLQDFVVAAQSDTPPELVFADGLELSSGDMLAAAVAQTTPAAGPGAGPAGAVGDDDGTTVAPEPQGPIGEGFDILGPLAPTSLSFGFPEPEVNVVPSVEGEIEGTRAELLINEIGVGQSNGRSEGEEGESPTAQPTVSPFGVDLINGLDGSAGFGENTAPTNDDGYIAVDVTSVFEGGLNIGGTFYDTLYINTNGNITFGSGMSTYTPFAIPNNSFPIIAPYFADVDTRGSHSNTPTPGGTSTGSNKIYYDFDTANDVFTITWDDVGYYGSHTDKLNAFQLRLYDNGGGDFGIEFRYEDVNWTTGDASGGSGGLGGVVSRAGWTEGDQTNYSEIPQSGDQSAMLALEGTVGNTGVVGLWQWSVVGGQIVEDQPSNFIELYNNTAADQTTLGNSMTTVGPGGAPLTFELPDTTVPAGGFLVLFENGTYKVYAAGSGSEPGDLIEEGTFTTAEWGWGADTTEALGVDLSFGGTSTDSFLANGASIAGAVWDGAGASSASPVVQEIAEAYDSVLGGTVFQDLVNNDTFNGEAGDLDAILRDLGEQRPMVDFGGFGVEVEHPNAAGTDEQNDTQNHIFARTEDLQSEVVVFDNGAYVDTAGGSGSESDTIQATLTSQGHNVGTFTGITAADFSAALSGANVLVIPEQEEGALGPDLSADAIAVIQNFVSNGGTLIISEDYQNFLNTVFGFSLTTSSSAPYDLTGDAVGSVFEGGPASLPYNDDTQGFDTDSLPAGSLSIYESGDVSAVALMPFGDGQIVSLGYDWFDAWPLGSQDSGWVEVLGRAVSIGLEPGAVVVEDTDSEADWTTTDAATAGGFNDASSINPQDDHESNPNPDDFDPNQSTGGSVIAGQTVYVATGDEPGQITGGRGPDFLYGHTGSDQIAGGDHNDFLFGDAGNDLLSGGTMLLTEGGGLFSEGDGFYIGGEGGADVLFDVDYYTTEIGEGDGGEPYEYDVFVDAGRDILVGGNGEDMLITLGVDQPQAAAPVTFAAIEQQSGFDGDLLVGDSMLFADIDEDGSITPFDYVRIGDVDGFGEVDTTGLVAANGGPADTDGDGLLEVDEFLPDRDGDGGVAFDRGDTFDNRELAELSGDYLEGNGYSDVASDGSHYTDVSLAWDYTPPAGLPPGQPGFVFDFEVDAEDIVAGTGMSLNLVFGDYDVFPAEVRITNQDGSTSTVALTLQENDQGEDGLIQQATAALDFGDVFGDLSGGVYHGHIEVDFLAPDEPYTTFDYIELRANQLVHPIGAGVVDSPVDNDVIFAADSSDMIFGDNMGLSEPLNDLLGIDYADGIGDLTPLYDAVENWVKYQTDGELADAVDIWVQTLHIGGGEHDSLGGDDNINAGGGDDLVFGQGGDDEILGEDGNDIIFGGGGDDLIDGGYGDDTIKGGHDFDTMAGGAGADTFVYDSVLDAGDVILGFSGDGDGDMVDLDGLLDELNVAGQTNRENRVEVKQDSSDVKMTIDVDGDGVFTDIAGGGAVLLATFVSASDTDVLNSIDYGVL